MYKNYVWHNDDRDKRADLIDKEAQTVQRIEKSEQKGQRN